MPRTMTPEDYADAPWPKRTYEISCGRPGETGEGHRAPPGYLIRYKQEVSGYRCDPFGARKSDGGGWALDHIPTGLAAGGYDTLTEAKDAARALIEHTGGTEPWYFERPDSAEDLPEAVRAALRAVRAP